MSRLLVSVAAAALLVGCARPAVQDLLTDQQYEDSVPVEVAAAPTTIVREVHYQAPEVYVDTVYLEYEAPAETVYVEEPVEYEYETYVYISEPTPPPHHFPHPRMSPPGHGGHGSRGGHVPRGGSGQRGGSSPRERGQRPPDGGERPRGGGQPRQPDPPERPRPVVGPTDGPKRPEPPQPSEPTPAVQAPNTPRVRPVRSEPPSAPAVQPPESGDAVFTIPVRDVKPIPVDRSVTEEQGS